MSGLRQNITLNADDSSRRSITLAQHYFHPYNIPKYPVITTVGITGIAFAVIAASIYGLVKPKPYNSEAIKEEGNGFYSLASIDDNFYESFGNCYNPEYLLAQKDFTHSDVSKIKQSHSQQMTDAARLIITLQRSRFAPHDSTLATDLNNSTGLISSLLGIGKSGNNNWQLKDPASLDDQEFFKLVTSLRNTMSTLMYYSSTYPELRESLDSIIPLRDDLTAASAQTIMAISGDFISALSRLASDDDLEESAYNLNIVGEKLTDMLIAYNRIASGQPVTLHDIDALIDGRSLLDLFGKQVNANWIFSDPSLQDHLKKDELVKLIEGISFLIGEETPEPPFDDVKEALDTSNQQLDRTNHWFASGATNLRGAERLMVSLAHAEDISDQDRKEYIDLARDISLIRLAKLYHGINTTKSLPVINNDGLKQSLCGLPFQIEVDGYTFDLHSRNNVFIAESSVIDRLNVKLTEAQEILEDTVFSSGKYPDGYQRANEAVDAAVDVNNINRQAWRSYVTSFRYRHEELFDLLRDAAQQNPDDPASQSILILTNKIWKYNPFKASIEYADIERINNLLAAIAAPPNLQANAEQSSSIVEWLYDNGSDYGWSPDRTRSAAQTALDQSPRYNSAEPLVGINLQTAYRHAENARVAQVVRLH